MLLLFNYPSASSLIWKALCNASVDWLRLNKCKEHLELCMPAVNPWRRAAGSGGYSLSCLRALPPAAAWIKPRAGTSHVDVCHAFKCNFSIFFFFFNVREGSERRLQKHCAFIFVYLYLAVILLAWYEALTGRLPLLQLCHCALDACGSYELESIPIPTCNICAPPPSFLPLLQEVWPFQCCLFLWRTDKITFIIYTWN